MAKQLGCAGLPDLLDLLEQNKDSKHIYILFCGESDDTGESWCPDCVKAEPVVEKVVTSLTDVKDTAFVMCSVGDKPTWKDPNCVFRTHPKLQLKGVPTLMKWNTPKRLGPEECAKEDLVRMIFEED